MKKILLIAPLLFVTAMQSCIQADVPGPIPEGKFFDFATTKTYNLEVNYQLNHTDAKDVINFEVYAENPFNEETIGGSVYSSKKENLTPVFRAFTDKSGYFKGDICIPTYVTKLYVYTSCFGVPSVMTTEVAAIMSVDANATVSADTRVATKGTVPSGIKVLGTWNNKGKPDYLLSKAILPPFLMEDIMTTLPDGVKLSISRPEYVQADAITNIRTTKATKVNMVFAHQGGSFLNTIGYYHFPTNSPPATIADINRIIAFPNASFSTSGGGLTAGDQIQLKYWNGTGFVEEFPAGTSIGFFLMSDAFKAPNVVPYNNRVVYSDRVLNSFISNVDLRQHNVALYDRDRKVVVVAFEDIMRNDSNPYNDGDFNDVIFYTTLSTENSIDTTDMPPVIYDPEPGPDPADNKLEYKGSLAFEDLWPYKGDYDMNDLVIDYFSTIYRDKDNNIIKVVDVFTPQWTGAAYHNAFGYRLGVTPSDVRSVDIKTTYTGGFSILRIDPTKKIELGHDKATVILFEDMNAVMGDNTGTVDSPSRNKNRGMYTFTVTTLFNTVLTIEDLTFPPYNPFIVAEVSSSLTVVGRKEVHLPNYKYTPLVTTKYFGLGDDKSAPAQGYYYISDVDFPFAIHIPETFDFPSERQRIDDAYSMFSEWASSRGTKNQDWYKHKNP